MLKNEKKLNQSFIYIFLQFSWITVRWNNILGFNVCGSRVGIPKGAGSILSMVVKSFDAHDDHGFYLYRNDIIS